MPRFISRRLARWLLNNPNMRPDWLFSMWHDHLELNRAVNHEQIQACNLLARRAYCLDV